jgi:zinc protease
MKLAHTTLIIAALACASGHAVAQRSAKLPARPTVPPPKPFVYPAVTLDTLPNGLRFAVVENHELPLVTVRTGFEGYGPGGLWHLDPAGKEGAWGLLLATLREGTAKRSGAQITDELADLGTDFIGTSSIAFIPPWFRAAKSTWRPSLDLLADMLVNPTIPADGLARVQANLATSIERMPPVTVANRILQASLYDAPGVYPRYASAASIRALTRDDLLALRQAYLGPQNAIVVIAGDVTRAEAREALQAAFGGWARSSATYTPVVPKPAARPTTIYLRDVPNQAMAVVAAAQILPGRDHADAAAIDALASVLGDFTVSSGSRVYRAFRTERGLSYSPRVELAARPIPETVPLIGTFSVPTASADTAIMTYLRVVQELKGSKPVTESELEFSKNNLIGKLPVDMEKLDLVSFNVISALRDRLPPSYLNDWIRRINALTLDQARTAAARYLDPDHMAIVVIADRAKVEGALRGTGLPVVIVDK